MEMQLSSKLPPPRLPATGVRAWWENLGRKKQIAIMVGTAVLLLLIGLGVYAAVRPRGGAEEGVFGNLPLSDLAERIEEEVIKPKVSPLSGVACEHADRRPIGVMLAGETKNNVSQKPPQPPRLRQS